MSDIVKSFEEFAPFYTPIPTIHQIKLTQVLRSIVACRVCRGERIVAVKSDSSKTFTYTRCFYCSGTGVMNN